MKIYTLRNYHSQRRSRIKEWLLRLLYGPKMSAQQHELYLRRREHWQDDALAFKLKLAFAVIMGVIGFCRIHL